MGHPWEVVLVPVSSGPDREQRKECIAAEEESMMGKKCNPRLADLSLFVTNVWGVNRSVDESVSSGSGHSGSLWPGGRYKDSQSPAVLSEKTVLHKIRLY